MTDSLIALEIGITMGLVMSFAVMALSFAYRLFDFPDLSIEGSYLFGAAIFATTFKISDSFIISLTLAVIAGGFIGFATGFIHAKLNLNKFLTAIIVVSIVYSLSLRTMMGPNIGLFQASVRVDEFARILSLNNTGVVKILFLIFVVAIISFSSVLLLKTKAGLKLRLAGCNPKHAKTLGIGIVSSTAIALAITNSLSALSGVIIAVQQGFVDIGMIHGVLIITLASMSIGERICSSRKLSLPAFIAVTSIVGSVGYQLIVAFAISSGINPIDLKLLTGVLVLGIVAINHTKNDNKLN